MTSVEHTPSSPENSGEQAPKSLLEHLNQLHQAAKDAEAAAEQVDRGTRMQAADYANRGRVGIASSLVRKYLREALDKADTADEEAREKMQALTDELTSITGQPVRFTGEVSSWDANPTTRVAAAPKRIRTHVTDGLATIVGTHSTNSARDTVSLALLESNGRTSRISLDKIEALDVVE